MKTNTMSPVRHVCRLEPIAQGAAFWRPPEGSAGCVVLLDALDGAQECRLGSVIKTFGGSYLAHTYAQEPNCSDR